MDNRKFYTLFQMIHLQLQRLLQENSTLHIQLSQRINCLQIQMDSIDDSTELNCVTNKLLTLQTEWKSSQANNLLKLQEKLLSQSQRLEQIAQYQRTIELMGLLYNKQKQIAFHQNQGKPFKRAGVCIEKLIYQQENENGITMLMRELKIKDELYKQVAELQINRIEKQQSKEFTERLQTAFLEQLLKEQFRNQKLKSVYKQLQQEIKTLSNNPVVISQNSGCCQNVVKSAKTISQTSDQD